MTEDPMRQGPPMRDPKTDPSKHAYYGGINKDGSPCVGSVVRGTKTCRMHGGKPLLRLKAEGAIVMQLKNWGLGDSHVDTGELMLRLVSQSARRVELYSALLKEAFEAADRLKAAHEAQSLVVLSESELGEEPRVDRFGHEMPERAALQQARADLDRIFSTGGVAALVGYTMSDTKTGDLYVTGEAIRGLQKLEAEERDRCFAFAHKARMAGIEERQVALAERMGAQMGLMLQALLTELNHNTADPVVVEVVGRHLKALMGPD